MEKVMIIEDNDMMRLFLTNYLSGDYEVETARNPIEAEARLKGTVGEFSMVISDYYQPNSREMNALKRMETSLKWQNIPLMILTDEDKSTQRITAFECGATDCLSKPFNPKELQMRMKTLVKTSTENIKYRTVA